MKRAELFSFQNENLHKDVERSAREGEDDLRSMVRQRESEVERLTRRSDFTWTLGSVRCVESAKINRFDY